MTWLCQIGMKARMSMGSNNMGDAGGGPDLVGRSVGGGPVGPHRVSVQSVATEQGGGPAPRGLAILLIGLIITLLSPVAAFLFGTYAESQLALWLLVGIGVGAIGVALIVVGGLRVYRDLSHRSVDESQPHAE